MINIESEMTTAIKKIGGERVSDYVGESPSFKNADFIFHDYKVVMELKCLDENKIADRKFIDKASKLYLEELKDGKAPVFVLGESEMSTKGFSEEYTEKIRNLYKTPIRARIKKANNQIKKTCTHLKVEEYKGVVAVVNNCNKALDPWHIHSLLKSIMDERCFRGINGILFFNGNQKSVLPETGQEFTAFVTLDRDVYPKVSKEFYSAFRDCWIEHYSKLINQPHYSLTEGDINDLARLQNN